MHEVRQALFEYSTDNAEEFSSEISTIEDKSELLKLKKALIAARDCCNMVRTFGDEDLKAAFAALELPKISQMISEVQHHIDAINQKEVNYILDDYDVYYNLKGGEIYDGAKAFFELSATAFEGRLGAPWILVILVSAVIALIIGLAVCAGVVASYKKKRASVDYPLEHFAKLELTRERDHEIGRFVTTTIISSGSRGGHGGGRGGGGGHAGGR